MTTSPKQMVKGKGHSSKKGDASVLKRSRQVVIKPKVKISPLSRRHGRDHLSSDYHDPDTYESQKHMELVGVIEVDAGGTREVEAPPISDYESPDSEVQAPPSFDYESPHTDSSGDLYCPKVRAKAYSVMAGRIQTRSQVKKTNDASTSASASKSGLVLKLRKNKDGEWNTVKKFGDLTPAEQEVVIQFAQILEKYNLKPSDIL